MHQTANYKSKGYCLELEMENVKGDLESLEAFGPIILQNQGLVHRRHVSSRSLGNRRRGG